MNGQLNTYRQIDTSGKSQIDLLLQVYTGALQALAAGREAYANQDNQIGYEQLEKARKFIVHLYTTLDFEQGGEVAANLGNLYAFAMNQIDLIQGTKNLAALDSCMTVLQNLRQGWDDLKRQSKPQKPASAACSGSFAASA